ncbi:hypothetical protein ACRRS0_02710 [Agarivorans sp. QJM3NY_29]|uniref:hypothetical protein n=1 Tax=unclassified Agarivorans TaxID=2636026 RepID=UPI003D7DCAB7
MNKHEKEGIKALFNMFWQAGALVGAIFTVLAFLALNWVATIQEQSNFMTRIFDRSVKWLFFSVPLGLLLIVTICLIHAVKVYIRQKSS